MKYFSTTLSLIFTFIFFIQNSAWATGAVASPFTQQQLEKGVESYNALSNAKKIEAFQAHMKSRPKADQDFMKNMGDITKVTFPIFKMVKGEIAFTHGKRDFVFKPKSPTVVTLEGQDIDFSPGKLEMAADQIEKIVSQQKFSLLDLVIAPAHANFYTELKAGGQAAVMVAVLMAFLATVIYAYDYFIATPESMREQCNKLVEHFKEIVQNGIDSKQPIEDAILKLRTEIAKTRIQLKHSKNCENHAKACSATKACLEDLTAEIQKLDPDAVSDQERGNVKDISPNSSGSQVPSSQAIGQ